MKLIHRKLTPLFVALSVPFAPTEAKAQTSRGQETPKSGVFGGGNTFPKPLKNSYPPAKKKRKEKNQNVRFENRQKLRV